ncbi:RNA-directed DNA polymerase [Citrobacter freundii]|uniref:RNA-directed DNA polymerase n=1 Tax=Citrobacter freundii TaxID=546 RepID=UPI001907A08F|nr:RNA-directed DNA polymerase [Citrobacter freundii]MBJ9306985.1 RNA-directed DNA polymerase [Citrobacter freundii]
MEDFKSVLDLDCEEAKKHFLKMESYFNSDLPPYFDFNLLLSKVAHELGEKEIRGIMKADTKVYECDNVNYTLMINKDGKLSWRPLQIIHPVLYINLVNIITKVESWEKIKSRFASFQNNPKIECLSMPVVGDSEKDKAAQVSNWWQKVELRSIELSLSFDYLYDTDITDCYGSIYTHSLAWAIETREVAKENKKDKNLLGNLVDTAIQNMQCGQTNGIPQGSVLMDFIAEILLVYVDEVLTEKLHGAGITDYKILRYRDDYRVFVNSPETGERILKLLSEVLSAYGLKLGSAKTKAYDDVVIASVKKDKLSWIAAKNSHKYLLKYALLIKQHANEHPNSGSLSVALKEFNERVQKITKLDVSSKPIISIIMDIAYRNPKVYPVSFAILSKFLVLIESGVERLDLMRDIFNKFNKLPNIGYFELWFQRAIKLDMDSFSFSEKLCLIAKGENPELWNSTWLASSKLLRVINETPIVDFDILRMTTAVIEPEEFDLFPGKSG